MSGVKGRSGRHPRWKELNQAEIIGLAGHTIRAYLRDETIPLEKRALISVPVYTKAIKQVNSTEITLVPYEQTIIDKYSKPLLDNTLNMITGTTGTVIDSGV